MKKLTIAITLFAILSIGIKCEKVNAANLEYTNDGIYSVDENEVLIYPNKMNLKHAAETNDINLTGDLTFIKGKAYSDVDFGDGTFDSEIGTFYTPIRGLDRNKNRTAVTQQAPWVIAYAKPVSVGEHNIDGTAVIRFREAAKTNDGVLCDVILTISNFQIKTARNLNYGMSFVESINGGEDLVGLGVGIFQQEQPGSYYISHPNEVNYIPTIGASYDISIKFVKANTEVPVDKKIVLIFKDIDNFDYTTSASWAQVPYTSGGKYAENITFISGFNEVVHLDQNSLIGVANHPEYGNNTIYHGTKIDDATNKSSISTRANTNNYEFRWTGSNCSTPLGFTDYYKISTVITGENKDHGTITETDDEVFWKANKTIVIKPDRGYKIESITVDGESILFVPEEDESYKYTFQDVIDNHSIEVEFSEQPIYSIRTKTDGNGSIEVIENARYKEYVYFRISAKDGYKLKKLTITSDSKESIVFEEISDLEIENNTLVLSKKFEMPSDNVTIEAEWEKSDDVVNPNTSSSVSIVLVFTISIVILLTSYLLYKKYSV